MSNKRKFRVNLLEFPETIIFRDELVIDESDYPELQNLSDQEAVDFIVQNADKMKPSDEGIYSSLDDELMDMDVVREKVPHVKTEIRAEILKD